MKTKNYLAALVLSVFAIYSASAFSHVNSDKLTIENQEPATTIIESLQNGESYSIEITSIGCFNGSRETITVSMEADVLTASYQDFSKILTDADYEAFRTFEIQLKALKKGGCSTVDTYVVRYGSETFRTSDGTCSWHGGKKLLKAIS